MAAVGLLSVSPKPVRLGAGLNSSITDFLYGLHFRSLKPVRLGAVLNSFVTIHCDSMIVKEHLIRGCLFLKNHSEKTCGDGQSLFPSRSSDLIPDG